MKYINKILFILLSIIILFATHTSAQNVEELRHDKEQAETELRKTNREIQKNLKSARSMINELELLNAEIKDRNKLINNISNEISRLNKQQRLMQDSISFLQKELDNKKTSYAKAIRNMGRQRNQYDELMFIFSAKSFDQSYRRMRYLKDYSNWRKRQAGEIVAKRQELNARQLQLDSIIAERNVVINERTKEANTLKSQQKDKKDFVSQLKKKEKSLRKEAEKQRKHIDQINKQIDKIIAEEARKAAERARKEAEAEAARLAAQNTGKESKEVSHEKTQKDEKKKTTSSAQYQMTRADRELSGSFEKNKGKLPFPISGQYRIVGHFGLQKHPEFKYLDKNNLGIDIETTPGTKARAVFGGEVAHIFSFGGAEKAVMIRHGNYYTVYTGLIEVYVKAGEKVEIRQNLGLIYSDPKDNNRTRMSFQIRKEMQKLNPEHWLDM